MMDFGLAKAPAASLGNLSASNSLATMSQPFTTEGTIVGTIQYMAPEQLEGKEADKRSDIFALGSVLYELITGKRAFEGKTTASTIASILAAEPKPLSTMQPLSPPPQMEHVIATCIAKNPDERWQSCADVSRQLQWAAKQPKAAEVSRRSGKLLWTLLAAGLMIAAAFVVGTRWSKGPAHLSQFDVNPPPRHLLQLPRPLRAADSVARWKQDRVRGLQAGKKRNAWSKAAFARFNRSPSPGKLATFGIALSAAGRWLAYRSSESSLPEIYVVPFRITPDGTRTPSIAGGKWQASNNGGTFPVWRGDGKELLFTNSSSAALCQPV